MAFRDLHTELQDLRRLDWTERRSSSGTAGMLLKAREQTSSALWYFKLSSYDPYRGVFGHECANELIAARLMDALGVDHVRYELVHALVSINGAETKTWFCRSKNFRAPGERKLGLDTYYELHAEPGELPLAFCERMGWGRAVQQMMAVDYLIANRDRHGANIEVLLGADGSVRLAPLFDCGLSFVFSCYGDKARASAFDAMADVPANNFLGTRSLEENLRFVEPGAFEGWELNESQVNGVLRGLDAVLPSAHLAKIREMIERRWARLEELRDS